MKIEAKCGTCKRVFLLSQISDESDSPGRCPFCGTRFGRHYTTLLPEMVREAETASDRFIRALTRLQGMETGFDVDVRSLLAEVANRVREAEAPRAS